MQICIFIFSKTGTSSYAPSPWETLLQFNNIYHWLSTYLDWSLLKHIILARVKYMHMVWTTQTAWQMWHPWRNSPIKILQTFRTIMPLFTFCCSLRRQFLTSNWTTGYGHCWYAPTGMISHTWKMMISWHQIDTRPSASILLTWPLVLYSVNHIP